jgi:hypothetical protein
MVTGMMRYPLVASPITHCTEILPACPENYRKINGGNPSEDSAKIVCR